MSGFETASAVEAPSRARGNLMILVLALSCFVFGCAYQYILGVPDQVAQIAGVDLSQVSLMMGVYGVCNAVGTPASGYGAHLARPESIAAGQPRAYGGGYGHLRRHPHLSRHFVGPCRHGRGQRHLRGNRLHRGKPHRRPFARRLGHVECGAGASAHRSSSRFPPRVCCATSSPGSRRIGCSSSRHASRLRS